MPTISGSLNLVTDRPVDSISEVWVRARETRGQGDGLVVGVNDRVSVSDGAVEFTSLSGAAVLVLVQNGMPLETLPMLVSDEAQQSLRAVVQAAEVAGSSDKREIEQLAAEFAASITLAAQYRTEAAASASSAQASESAAATSESNAKTSETRAKQSETNAGDFAAVATTAAAEAVDAMDAAALSAAAFSIYTGIGSPEGTVTAPIGSVYTDSAATNGAIRWIKTSGTGSTGWRVEYGDTGWRAIAPVGENFEGTGTIQFRRTGTMVSIKFQDVGIKSTIGTYTYLTDAYYVPQGFRVGYSDRPTFWVSNSSANPNFSISIAQGSRIRYQSTTATGTNPGTGNQALQGQGTWRTDDPWPTSLPGTPA